MKKLALGIIFLSAFGLRLFHITDPPWEFHLTRQYHSALIVQSYYYNWLKDIEPWQSKIATINRKNYSPKEPPIMEGLTFGAYLLAGKEVLWMSRLISVFFWLAGGIFLFLLVRNLFGPGGGVLSTIVYLFFPFGINISRALMPESLMCMMTLCSLWLIVRLYQEANTRNLVLAAVVSGLAILVKFVVIFPIMGAFFFLGIQKKGLKNFTLNPHTILFLVGSLSIGLLYYFYSFLSSSSLQGTGEDVFLPKLIFSSFFWKGWVKQIGLVVGFIPFVLGALGFYTIRDRSTKTLLAGLFSGYFIYGLIFTYTTATHDYYQIALFLIVIIALGRIGEYLAIYYSSARRKFYLASFVLLPLCIISLFFSLATAQWDLLDHGTRLRLKNTSALICGNQLYHVPNVSLSRKIEAAEEIGEIVNHSDRTIFLAHAYGYPLRYHGVLAGRYWPNVRDLWARNLKGAEPLSIEELYNQQYSAAKAEYFIIEDMAFWKQQPDLQHFLKNRFSLLVENQDYLIFKLTTSALK